MDDSFPDSISPRAGSLCLVAGTLGLLVAGLAHAGALPDVLTRLWFRSGPLFVGLSALLLLSGGALLWRSGHRATSWRPSAPGRRFNSAVFYTRADCPLCEEAREILASYRRHLPPLVEVDVDGDPELARRIGTCVPVVEFDGKVRFRGRVSEALLRRLLEGTPPGARL
jgi:glutaredoxin